MNDIFIKDSALAAAIRLSPNFDQRPDGQPVDMILLHYTGMPDADGALERLVSPDNKVSAHYLVAEDGVITQLVQEAHRAWHAGAGSWHGKTDINACSIGIEIVNPGHEHGYREFPSAQIDAVIALCKDIAERHSIKPERILGHSDTAPARKQDPGELFPWDRLHAAGIGLWTEPAPLGGGRFLTLGDRGEPVEALQAMLALFGYGIEITGDYDDATALVVTAFQRHFRPARIDGVADTSTVTTLRNLLRLMHEALLSSV